MIENKYSLQKLQDSEKVFKNENEIICYNNNHININNNKKISNTSYERDETSTETPIVENISKFDKYFYTFLLCYANMTYVSFHAI